MSDESVMSSRLRNHTDCTEAEDRDATHQARLVVVLRVLFIYNIVFVWFSFREDSCFSGSACEEPDAKAKL